MSAGPSDEELLAAYAAGDARAFGELYDRHERPVYRYFLRQGAAPALADDLLQETWMAVIRHAERFEPRAKFTTWLYTVARSKMADHWRQREDAVTIDEAANDPDEAPLELPGSDADRPDVQVLSGRDAGAGQCRGGLVSPARDAGTLSGRGADASRNAEAAARGRPG